MAGADFESRLQERCIIDQKPYIYFFYLVTSAVPGFKHQCAVAEIFRDVYEIATQRFQA